MIIKYKENMIRPSSTFIKIKKELQSIDETPKIELSEFLATIDYIDLSARLITAYIEANDVLTKSESEEAKTYKTKSKSKKYKTKSNSTPTPVLVEDILSQYFLTPRDLSILAEAYPNVVGRAKLFAEAQQKTSLIQNGLMNKWNSNFTIFTATNLTDMKQRQTNENINISAQDLLDRLEQQQQQPITLKNAEYKVKNDYGDDN